MYEGIGEHKCLNVSVSVFDMKSPLTKSIIKKSGSSKSANTLQIITDQTYNITGETLMSRCNERYEMFDKHEVYEQYIRLIHYILIKQA